MPPKPIGLDQCRSASRSDSNALSDREFQDRVICYLADASARSSHEDAEFLDPMEAKRAQRFSRFLARRYYRDRLHRGFRYSAGLVAPENSAEKIVDSPEFESLLDNCVLGSIATAKNVGQLAHAHLLHQRQEVWWSELLEYEFAFFTQLATGETASPSSFARKNSSVVLHRFHVRVPEWLLRLKTGKTDCADLIGDATLLFSRTHHGKIYVVELDENTAAVFTAIDGRKSAPQISNALALPVEEIQGILAALSDIGAVVQPAAATLEPVV